MSITALEPTAARLAVSWPGGNADAPRVVGARGPTAVAQLWSVIQLRCIVLKPSRKPLDPRKKNQRIVQGAEFFVGSGLEGCFTKSRGERK